MADCCRENHERLDLLIDELDNGLLRNYFDLGLAETK
jgi:hypothetical protein